ncbi:hypothetical protein Mal64_12910 [Pseudobythopirellula maris]|uniref:DUF1570 domain-containing protein n=1 Tax=Pseudobythopirellula maris TaxID=2527991 RepID=A0A5C5ZX49_9BACT|nr:hypothetical protein [Pseudobythopirellula maris]TWT90893.1 hypothetical protein Mal64_12910 [Pseudobythopirellula maris]
MPDSVCFRWIVAAALCLATTAAVAQRRAEPALWPQPRGLDARRLERAGLRIVQSERLTLVTDLAPSSAVDTLGALFDAATPLWAERFGVDGKRLDGWRARAYLMGDRARFDALGLTPERDFPDGLNLGAEIWLVDQPSDYYRRHLLLHEGTHAFMATLLGGCGPGWYMEGVAELCGTHRWDAASGELTLGVIPASRQDARMWGRTRLVRDAVEGGRGLPIEAVMRLDNRSAMPAESYAWTWALAKWLDTHPRYRQRFRALHHNVLWSDFNERFRTAYADDWQDLQAEWRQYVHAVGYGYDYEREAIDFRDGSAMGDRPHTTQVAADRGWQSSGVRVEAGRAYRLTAEGRFRVAAEPDGTPWPCEPGGVTLAWRDGRPLGELLAAVDPPTANTATVDSSGGFAAPTPVGLGATLRPGFSGTLYLRVNDGEAGLAENSGELTVRITQQP